MRNIFSLICLLWPCLGLAQPASPADISDSYATKANMQDPAARQDLNNFVAGLGDLVTNLADFCFLDVPHNNQAGVIVSLNSSAIVPSNTLHTIGGLVFSKSTAAPLEFTNLPDTPDGRTIIVWASQDYNGSPTNAVVVELTGPGSSWRPVTYSALVMPDARGLQFLNFNGTNSRVGSIRPIGKAFDNKLFCYAGFSSRTTNGAYIMSDSYTLTHHTIRTLYWTYTGRGGFGPTNGSPVALRFGTDPLEPNAASWSGIIRGWALFNRVLTTNEIASVNSLVPRVGLIVTGDSKSTIVDWSTWYVQDLRNWGLVSLLTNSAKSGATMSPLNKPGITFYYGITNDQANFHTNATFPVIVYAVRGGQNDLKYPPASVSNAFVAAESLWAQARSNGWKVMAWTLDRTSSWQSRSNYMKLLNAQIRAANADYDYLFDAEAFFLNISGSQTPYKLASFYSNGLHDKPSAPRLGTNGIAYSASGFLYSYSQPTLGFTNSVWAGGSLIVSGNGGTPGGNYKVLAFTNAATPSPNWTTSGISQFDINGGFVFTNTVSPGQPAQFFRLEPF